MTAAVEAAGRHIDRVFVCLHHPNDGCACRKPHPGLLREAAVAFDLHLPDCYFIFDALSDLLAAQAAGCRRILLQSGLEGYRLSPFLKGEPEVLLLPYLAHAVGEILAQEQSPRHRT